MMKMMIRGESVEPRVMLDREKIFPKNFLNFFGKVRQSFVGETTYCKDLETIKPSIPEGPLS